MIKSSFEVTKNSFDNEKVWFMGIVHVKTNLVDSVGDFRPS